MLRRSKDDDEIKEFYEAALIFRQRYDMAMETEQKIIYFSNPTFFIKKVRAYRINEALQRGKLRIVCSPLKFSSSKLWVIVFK